MTVVDGDVREAAAILDAVAAGIDLSAPACLLMGFLPHFRARRRAGPRGPVRCALAPGSYVVLSAGRGDSDAADQGFGAYSSGAARVYNYSVPEFTSFFAPLVLVPPGVADARIPSPP